MVAFPSVAAVRQAAIDGNVAAAMLALGDAIAAAARWASGRHRHRGRRPASTPLPDLPTLTETGIGFTATLLRGAGGAENPA